jgi:mycothiol system anti-sigma-R factor
MGDCEATLRELRSYLDRELPDEARAEVDGHIEGCLDCLQAFDFHAELRQVIAQRCTDDLPPGLVERIRRCLDEAAVEAVADGESPSGDDGVPA